MYNFEWTEDEQEEEDLESILELRQVFLTLEVAAGLVSCLLYSPQACLGVDAKPKERNVVQVTTENEGGVTVTHTILSMRLGVNEQVSYWIKSQRVATTPHSLLSPFSPFRFHSSSPYTLLSNWNSCKVTIYMSWF